MNGDFQVNDWQAFYEIYDLEAIGKPSEQGWLTAKCPFHPYDDEKGHAAINVYSGNYKCWDSACHSSLRTKLGSYPTSGIVTPKEFLVLQGYESNEARQRVFEYTEGLDQKTRDVVKLERVYRPKREWKNFVEIAQKNLRPTLDSVRVYCEEKHITYDTLLQFKFGAIGDETLIIPYYYNGVIVGYKLRLIDGKKRNAEGSYQCLYNLDTAVHSNKSTCILVEGETDCIYLSQILREAGLTIPVIATPGAAFKPEWTRNLNQFVKVLYIPQADQAAKALLSDLTKELGTKLEVINLPWSPLTWGKDIVEFCSQHSDERLISLLGSCDTSNQRILTGSELCERGDQEIPYIIPELIERNTKTLIVGEPKTYKTWMALQLMDTLINGTPFMGVTAWVPTVNGLRVMLVEEEGSTYRLGKRLKHVTGGQANEDMIILHRQNIMLDNPDSLSKLTDDVITYKPDVLILDPFANLHSQDENSATGIMQVMGSINRLMNVNPAMAVVIIHHTTKVDKKMPRGSSALWGNVDQLISVYRQHNQPIITLETKGRDTAETEQSNMQFVFDDVLMKHKQVEIHLTKPSEEGEDMSSKPKTSAAKLALLNLLKREPNNSYTKQQLRDSLAIICSAPTADSALDELVEEGILNVSGKGKRGHPFTYTLTEERREYVISGEYKTKAG